MLPPTNDKSLQQFTMLFVDNYNINERGPEVESVGFTKVNVQISN